MIQNELTPDSEQQETYIKLNNYNYALNEEFDYLDDYQSPWINTESAPLAIVPENSESSKEKE